MSTSRTVARNSVWYGLETAVGVLGAVLTSVAAARVFGPEKLGHFNTVLWLTSISGLLANVGLAQTARKYMSEYLATDDHAMCRAIYRFTLRLQSILVAVVVLAGLVLVAWLEAPERRVTSWLLVLAIFPRIVTFVPSNAIMAREDMPTNTKAAVVGAVLQVGTVGLALLLNWGLEGVAAASVLAYSVELMLKLRGVGLRPALAIPLPDELRRRMFHFSTQGLALMALNIIVWDRSDIIFLRWLQPDIREVAFFALAFNLAEKILLLPQAFSIASSVSLMAEYGRDRRRAQSMTVTTGAYTLLLGLPVLVGAAAISNSALRAYGVKFEPVIPVFIVVVLMGAGKAILLPAQTLLQASENQGSLIWISLVCGCLHIGMDLVLIRPYGAMGAAWANGLTQTAASVAAWYLVWRKFDIEIPWGQLVGICLSSMAMGVCAWLPTQVLSPLPGTVTGIVVGMVVYPVALLATGALRRRDGDRILKLGGSFPGFVRPYFDRLARATLSLAKA